jgi:hypothetical protein
MPDTAAKDYLGDSVYVELIDGFYVLTTENGGAPSNKIYLDQGVYVSLQKYVKNNPVS